jgi:hypothetical protein
MILMRMKMRIEIGIRRDRCLVSLVYCFRWFFAIEDRRFSSAFFTVYRSKETIFAVYHYPLPTLNSQPVYAFNLKL